MKIHIIDTFLNQRESKKEIFQTEVAIKQKNTTNTVETHYHEMNKNVLFEEAVVPPFEHGNSFNLDLPVSIVILKKNAIKQLREKNIYEEIISQNDLNELINFMISDCFWFTVLFYKNEQTANGEKMNKFLSEVIEKYLKKISQNYFNFFIKLCEQESTNTKVDRAKPILDGVLKVTI